MNNCCFKRFAAWLTGCVLLVCLCAEIGLAQTNPAPAPAGGKDLLGNLQELLRTNQQLQEQLRAARSAIDQTGALLTQPDAAPVGASGSGQLPGLQELLGLNRQLQEELRATRLALDQNQKEAEAAAARNAETARNAEALSARLRLLEQELADQRTQALEVVQSSNRFMLIVAAVVASVGLLSMLLTAYLHRRALSQLAAVPVAFARGQGSVVASVGGSETSLVPIGQTEQSTARLLGAINRLEKQIAEMERATSAQQPGVKSAAETTAAETRRGTDAAPESAEPAARIALLLGKGESLLQLGQAEEAIACFDEILRLEPHNTDALVKKGAAIEQLERWDEAIACYDLAIGADRSMATAYLRKGGVCNRMGRSSEALECYEQALRAQKGTPAA